MASAEGQVCGAGAGATMSGCSGASRGQDPCRSRAFPAGGPAERPRRGDSGHLRPCPRDPAPWGPTPVMVCSRGLGASQRHGQQSWLPQSLSPGTAPARGSARAPARGGGAVRPGSRLSSGALPGPRPPRLLPCPGVRASAVTGLSPASLGVPVLLGDLDPPPRPLPGPDAAQRPASGSRAFRSLPGGHPARGLPGGPSRGPGPPGPAERRRSSTGRADARRRDTGRGSQPPGPGHGPRPRPEKRAPRARPGGARTH